MLLHRTWSHTTSVFISPLLRAFKVCQSLWRAPDDLSTPLCNSEPSIVQKWGQGEQWKESMYQAPNNLPTPLCDTQPGICNSCTEEEMGPCTNPQMTCHTSLWQSARYMQLLQRRRDGVMYESPETCPLPLCDSQPITCTYCTEEMGSCTNSRMTCPHLSVMVSQAHWEMCRSLLQTISLLQLPLLFASHSFFIKNTPHLFSLLH